MDVFGSPRTAQYRHVPPRSPDESPDICVHSINHDQCEPPHQILNNALNVSEVRSSDPSRTSRLSHDRTLWARPPRDHLYNAGYEWV